MIESDHESDDDHDNRRGRPWSKEEHLELLKLVRQFGEGNWKAIFDNSHILQERYKMAPSGTSHLRFATGGAVCDCFLNDVIEIAIVRILICAFAIIQSRTTCTV